MSSKTFQTAHLAALLAVHTDKSAYVCADLAIKLKSLGDKQTRSQTFECNGYKTEYQDAYLNKLSRENVPAANAYALQIQVIGANWCEKQERSIKKSLDAIVRDTGLNIEPAGLSGLVWRIDAHTEYFI